MRRVEDVTEALWGTRVSSGTVSRLNQRIDEQIDAWRPRPITGSYPYVYLDGVSLKRSWGGEVRNVSVRIAIGVGADGYRHILGVAEGEKEDLDGWRGFLRHLKTCGLKGVQLIISDACVGLVEAAAEGIVKLRLAAVFDAQHDGFATGWPPASWGSIDELFVNLTMPHRHPVVASRAASGLGGMLHYYYRSAA